MSGSESNTDVDGSGILETSPMRVIIPVALRVWTAALPLQVSARVPVNGTVVPRTPVLEIFSVKLEFWLNADSPVKVNPPRFDNWNRLPVKTLPDPLLLPEGTVNDARRLVKLEIDERLAQPLPEHAALAVINPLPVSVPLVVKPRSKLPPVKLIVI
jgi:hypothetical protein